jgi:hypothetical protein
VAKSMNGIKTIETSSITFTDDNSSLNSSAGISQAQQTGLTALNAKINSVDFDTNTGVLTLNKEDSGTITKDLDGRYFVGTTLTMGDIPDLNASKITSGTLGTDRIPNLDANKITSGTLNTARIPDLDTAKITTGTLDIGRIPDLNASKITAGTFDTTRIPDLDTAKITTGTFDIARIPDLPYVETTGNETISGVKTFSSLPQSNATPSADSDLITKIYGASEYVATSRNQNIGGVKTFTSFPVKTEPNLTPSTDGEFATKKYVDDSAGSPSNMMTTDTNQTITGTKTFNVLETNFPYRIIQSGGSTDNFIRQSGANCAIQQTGSDTYIQQSGMNCFFRQTQGGARIITQGHFLGNSTPSNANKYNGYTNSQYYTTHPSFRYFAAHEVTGNNNYQSFASIVAGGTGGQARIYFRNPNTYMPSTNFGSVYIYASSYQSSSDDRIKHKEEYITNALQTICKLIPQKYLKYCEGEKEEDGEWESGLISQQIWYDCPELRFIVKLPPDADPQPLDKQYDIHDDPDYEKFGWTSAMSSVDYTSLSGYIIQAIKELNEKNQELHARIEILEQQLNIE